MNNARAFWLREPGQGEIRDEPLPAPASNEVRVEALYSGVSRGTEALVFQGRVPASQRDKMRAPFQAGNFPAPVKYGYASVGVVTAGANELRGRTVFCLHPHQSAYVVPAGAVTPLPTGLPPARAVLAANMETALNAVWDSQPLPGDCLSVVGGGVVGCLLAWLLARMPGTRVELVDIDADRAKIAHALGCAFAMPSAARADNDIVYHTSGAPAGLSLALSIAGYEADVIELSWYGEASVAAPLGEDFHSKRLSIRASQVGAVAPARRARATHARRMRTALDLLQNPCLDILISGESPFDNLPETMARLSASPDGALCHRIRY